MSNQTVYDCEGTLSDSEANSQQAGWYDHNENFTFTICPNGASSIIIDFSFFKCLKTMITNCRRHNHFR